MLNFNTISFLENAAQSWPDKTAVIDGDEKTTFKQLLQYSLSFEKLLTSQLVLKGKGIAFMCSNSSRFVAGLFGCSATGAVVMPMLPGLKSMEIENLLWESSINILVAEKNCKFDFSITHHLQKLNDDFNLYSFPEISSLTIESIFPDAAFIRPTSGTTGNAKGVVISHLAVFERTASANEGMHLNETHSMLWVMPMAFHFVVSILLYIRYGVTLVLCNEFYAASIISVANKFKATHLYASPIHYRLLAAANTNEKFETLQKCICTSAGIEKEVIKIFFEKYNVPVMQAYGIIEIGLPLINDDVSGKRVGSIGKALPAYKAVILDTELKECIEKAEGLLAIKGPGMFSGYLYPLKKASEVLVDGWFHTGDIAEKDADGYIFINGRSKSIINVSGNKVFPEEVELVLLQHKNVSEVRVYRGHHKLTGEMVIAEVVLQEDSVQDTEELIEFCSRHLVAYKVPAQIYFVNEISKTKTGKIKRD